jgi:hypothetical protein
MRTSERSVFWGLNLWQLLWIFGIAAYVSVAFVYYGVAFRYLCVGAIVVGLAASGRENARRFLLDWLPLLLFWIGYDGMRGFADELVARVTIREVYELERTVFGWMAGGEVPAIYFLSLLEESRWKIPVNTVADLIYWSHFVVVPGYMLYLWWRPPTPPRFRRFVVGLTLLHALALTTYFLYPVAPPWYVFYFGFDAPSLAWLDPYRMNPPALFERLWAANPNWFAAVPSLHGAYPIFLWCLVEPSPGARRRVTFYAAAVWLATVVRGHHYIVDLILGALYAVPCAWLAHRLVRENRRDHSSATEAPVEEPSARSIP